MSYLPKVSVYRDLYVITNKVEINEQIISLNTQIIISNFVLFSCRMQETKYYVCMLISH